MNADPQRCGERRHRLLERVPEVDLFLINEPYTQTWLTGYSPLRQGMWEHRQPLLIIDRTGHTLYILPELYVSEFDVASFQAAGGEVVTYSDYGPHAPELPTSARHAFEQALPHLPAAGKSVGIQGPYLPAEVLELVRERYGGQVIDIEPSLQRLRAVKDLDEIALIRKAVERLEEAYQYAAASVHPGMTEAELYGAVYAKLAQDTGRPVFFQGDIVSGPRAAHVGGWASDRTIERGDPLILDLWTTEGGYWADNCRTLIVGSQPTTAQQRVIDTLLRAFDAAEAILKPGTRACDVYALVKDTIEKGDLSLQLPHHAGHGIGVHSHEGPFFLPQCLDVLEPGMVVTLEPGAYPGGDVGGFRIEDDFLITDTGCERLNSLPRQL